METLKYKTELNGNNYELITENNKQYLINNNYNEYPESWEEFLTVSNRSNCKIDDIISSNFRCFIEMMLIYERWKEIANQKVDWNNYKQVKYTIKCIDNNLVKSTEVSLFTPIAFTTPELRDKFLKTFEADLNACKYWLQ